MMVMSVVGMTFSYFSSKTNGGSNNLSFGVLSTQVSLNNSSFSDNPQNKHNELNGRYASSK